MSDSVKYVHVNDDDLDWLHAESGMLTECIRQTIDAKVRLEGMTTERANATNAVRTLKKLRDRYDRIANRLAPTVTITCGPAR